jgi:hypothetical protein
VSTPARVVVVEVSSRQLHLAVGAVVCALVAIAYATVASHVSAKVVPWAVTAALALGLIAIVVWGTS